MDTNPAHQEIIRSTIELAHGLGLHVVAEGVEVAAAFSRLAALGCDRAQGYWLARPTPMADIPAAVADLNQRLTPHTRGSNPPTRTTAAPTSRPLAGASVQASAAPEAIPTGSSGSMACRGRSRGERKAQHVPPFLALGPTGPSDRSGHRRESLPRGSDPGPPTRQDEDADIQTGGARETMDVVRDGLALPVIVLVTGFNDYQATVIGSVAATLGERSIPLLAVSIDSFASDETSTILLDLIRRHRSRGVIALSGGPEFRRSDLQEALRASGTPIVTLMGVDSAQPPRIRGDNVTGMRALMQHLLDGQGVRRPVLVRGIPDHLDSVSREVVFREECARRGIVVDEGLVLDGWFRPKPARDAVESLLRRRQDFDAVVALNDMSAFGALSALTQRGLRVPDDVLVTGFDNSKIASETWPPLTTVDQHLDLQGARAVLMLEELLAGDVHEHDVQVPSQLVVRASTGGEEQGIERIATVARRLQANAVAQQGAVEISRAMANCRDVRDIARSLDASLTQLGVSRCFVGLYEGTRATDVSPPAVEDPTALAFSFRDGRPEPVPEETFSRHVLLPPSLWSELGVGNLFLQPLSVGGRERGYVLYDIDRDSPVLADALSIELPRTIDVVLSAQELKDHASTLERLVAQRTRELAQANADLEQANSGLERANRELQRSAMCDGLTGIANRRAFQQFLEECWRTATTNRQVALLMIDVDMFKAFNDRYGHLAGDDALRTVASCLERVADTPGGLACRYGGEEFAVVLQDTDATGALCVANRFRQFLTDAAIPHHASPVASIVTTSVGVAMTSVERGTDPTVLIAAADEALYQAKVQGRDCVVAADARTGLPRQRTGSGPSLVRSHRDPA